jgi:gliding motility-associated-like protein
VSQVTQPSLVITNPPTTCIGSTVDLTDNALTAGSSRGLTFSYWTDAATQNALANPNAISASGTYYIKATNAAGCSQIQPVSVTITGSPTLVVTSPASVCSGSPIDLTDAAVTAGSDPSLTYSYWQDRFATQSLNNPGSVSVAGTYYIKASASGGCFMILPVTVSINQPPTALFSGDQNICPGMPAQLNINLTGKGPWNVVYSDGNSTFTINSIGASIYPLTVSPGSTTAYSILSVSDASCTNTNVSAATVTVTPGAAGIRYPDVSAFANVPIQLSARDLGNNYSYEWAPATGLDITSIQNPIFNYGFSTQYNITLRSPTGCVTVDTVFVSIKNPQDRGLSPDLLVSKAWTPNNDGMNDILYPITIHIKQINYFRVFNRWGQLVYETNILGQGWNGIYHDQPQVSDVYTWTVEAIGDDNSVIRKAGNSILLR